MKLNPAKRFNLIVLKYIFERYLRGFSEAKKKFVNHNVLDYFCEISKPNRVLNISENIFCIYCTQMIRN